MMEKMGWAKGRGLGAKEDGNREHITLAFKNDSKGKVAFYEIMPWSSINQ